MAHDRNTSPLRQLKQQLHQLAQPVEQRCQQLARPLEQKCEQLSQQLIR